MERASKAENEGNMIVCKYYYARLQYEIASFIQNISNNKHMKSVLVIRWLNHFRHSLISVASTQQTAVAAAAAAAVIAFGWHNQM